jgi:hypothetical protein
MLPLMMQGIHGCRRVTSSTVAALENLQLVSVLSISDATSGPYSSPHHFLHRLLRRVLEFEAESITELNGEDVVAELECPIGCHG